MRRTTRGAPPGDGPGSGTREQIVAAAEDLIARHGLEGLQVKAIAARVGIRPPSIFAHFAGRDDIVGAVVERLLGRLEALFDAPPAGTPEEELRTRTRQLVMFLVENPADARILLRELAQAGAPEVERHDLRARLLERIYDRVAAVLHRGAATGEFRRLRTESFVAQLLGGILAQLAWAGWDVAGRPRPVVPRAQLIRDAEDLAVALVQPRVGAGAGRSGRNRAGPKPQAASGTPRRPLRARGRRRSEPPR